jgi:hypothetical protein
MRCNIVLYLMTPREHRSYSVERLHDSKKRTGKDMEGSSSELPTFLEGLRKSTVNLRAGFEMIQVRS